MVGTSSSGRPGGNPNLPKEGNPNMSDIGKQYLDRRTGPKTEEGKLKQALSAMQYGYYSKVLEKIRVCQRCPLGPRIDKRNIRGQEVDVSVPAKCLFYMKPETEGGTKCVIPVKEYVGQIKLWYDVIEKLDTIELQKFLIGQSLQDALANRDVETLTKGAPGFYTHAFQEQALKYTDSLNRPKIGVNVNVGGGMAEKLLGKFLDGEEIKEEKKVEVEQSNPSTDKVIDAEFKENEKTEEIKEKVNDTNAN